MPQSVYDEAPPQARDPDRPLTLHWAATLLPDGSVLDGALWALSWSLQTVFGSSLGGLLEEATLTNVERWNGSSWEQIA